MLTVYYLLYLLSSGSYKIVIEKIWSVMKCNMCVCIYLSNIRLEHIIVTYKRIL